MPIEGKKKSPLEETSNLMKGDNINNVRHGTE